MVRVKLIVRVIPENVYLQGVKSTASRLVTEKRLLQIVDEPEHVLIGSLANEIKDTFQRINHDPLGDIKYLKDGQFDADLDPAMSVYDAFVDAGRAGTSPDDQTATIKIIREIRGRHFRAREGSVEPDLSNPRFQPRKPPPVPRFSDTIQSLGKRSRDDAFREESSGRHGSHGSNSTRRRRRRAFEEGEIQERLVPWIEPEVYEPSHEASRHHQASPILIPETQGSARRCEMDAQQSGSEILGDDESTSESPEIGNSTHSLLTVRTDVNDMGIHEAASPMQDLTEARSRILDNVQARSTAALARNPTSRSSSKYYSPTSGSVPSSSEERVYGNSSDSCSAVKTGVLNRGDPIASFTRTKLDLTKEGTDRTSPITPPSDAARRRKLTSTAQESTNTLPDGAEPQSRTSSFTYKFRRGDRVHSAESEIDDTQMSPRSRKSLKRPRDARYTEAMPKSVGLKELSGLFHLRNENQPLIQERKRQREAKGESCDHVEGLSEIDDEHSLPFLDHAQNEAQKSTTSGESSASGGAEDSVGQRAKSHALSDATNKDSNASTERPTSFTRLSAIRASQPAESRPLNHGAVSDTMAEHDSDKENAMHERTQILQFPLLDIHQNVEVAAQSLSKTLEKESGQTETQSDGGKNVNALVVEILNDDSNAQDRPNSRPDSRSNQRLPHELEHLKSSESFPNYAGPKKKPRTRKKKSRVEDEPGPEPDTHQREAHVAEASASKVFDRTDHDMLSSTAKSNTDTEAVPGNEPDEQLSQDLQASAQAGSNERTSITNSGKIPGQKQLESPKNGAGDATAKPVGMSSSKVPSRTTNVNQQKQQHPSDVPKNSHHPNDNDEALSAAADATAKSANQGKDKDGKLGLGFSQSPPRKRRALQQSNASPEPLDHKGQGQSSGTLTNGKERASFLKRSKSLGKFMSSQNWDADTPSRSAEPAEKMRPRVQRESVNISERKPNYHGPQTDTTGGAPVARGSEMESGSGSDDDCSLSAVAETSKFGQITVKPGTKSASVDAAVPSLEISSDSSRVESDAVKTSSRTANKASKPPQNGPTIVRKGNNVYDIDGTTILVPQGFTLEGYLAMRANLANQPPRPNQRNRMTSFGKSATPTLNQKGSSATPFPAPVKVVQKKSASKDNDKQQPDTTKGRESKQISTAALAAKTSVKQVPNAKTHDVTPTPVAPAARKPQPAEVLAVSKAEPTTKANVSAKNRPVDLTSANGGPSAPTPGVSTAPIKMSAKKPAFLQELKAQREADRTEKMAASASKSSGTTNLNSVNGKTIFGGADSDSESESETESDTTSPERGSAASNPRPEPGRTTSATRPTTVDLSIRDPSPSSDEADV